MVIVILNTFLKQTEHSSKAEYIDCEVLPTKNVLLATGRVFKLVVYQDSHLLQEVNPSGFHFICYSFELGNIFTVLVTTVT